MDHEGNAEQPIEGMGFEAADQVSGEAQTTLKEISENLEELSRMIAEEEAELARLILANKSMEEADFPLVASEQDIEAMRDNIRSLGLQKEKYEALQAKAIHRVDALESRDQRRMDLLQKPTDEPNPDDANL